MTTSARHRNLSVPYAPMQTRTHPCRVVRPYKALYECAMVRTDLQLPTARAG